MEQNNRIKEGDWFCAIEGLAIADKVFNFYYEEFIIKLPEGKEVGDYHLSMIRYRIIIRLQKEILLNAIGAKFLI